MRNGALVDGEFEKVSSSVIALNGVQVLGPEEFNQNVTLVEKPVTLQASNQLSVEVRGKPGGALSVEIIGVDNDPPTITAAATPAPNAAGWNNTDVTVSFACDDATSGVATCPAATIVSGEGANQVISGTAVDKAGNTATASLTLNLDKTKPTISGTAAPAPNAAGWNRTDVAVSFTCADTLSGVATCASPVAVTTETASQVVSGTVLDRAGNTATASVAVKLDKTGPSLTITSPANNASVASSPITVTGTVSDALSGVTAVTCNGAAATLSSGSFACNVPLNLGPTTITVQATDTAGNTTPSSITVTLGRPIVVRITSPAPLAVFGASPITVTGTLDEPAATVTVNGVAATVSGGTFTATGVALREGHNIVTATATGPAGNVGTGSVDVILDTTPPTVRINTPADGAIITGDRVTITGVINDMVSGTVNAEQASVTVNGIPATVSNRGFVLPDLALRTFPNTSIVNTLTAIARDRAGNTGTHSIKVTAQSLVGQRINLVSGNNQSGVIGTALSQPLVVSLTDANGNPVAGRSVTFSVTRSDGKLTTAAGQQGRSVSLVTDANGRAQVTFTLGTRAGAGSDQVTAQSAGFVGAAVFTASATAGAPAQIVAVSGENQRAPVGAPLPLPFVAAVFDSGGNPVAGVGVTFTVGQGGGSLEGASTVMKNTDGDGKTAVVLTLGLQAGINNNGVSATVAGLADSVAIFNASGLSPGPAANTRVSGVVLDNSDKPIPNATAKIVSTSLTALTNAEGQFTISGAPVGTITLIVDGSTSTRPESFPFLAFQLATIAGQDNTVGMPIYLPPLDNANSKIVGGDTDVVLAMAGVPGVAFTVFARSATFPDGSKLGRLSLTQVHADKVPMPPPNGTAPRVMWTLQPAGVKFDPPIRVQLPNTENLALGQVIEIVQFDHDLEQFVSVGTARASEDGLFVVSDPGFGITKSGWGGPECRAVGVCLAFSTQTASGCEPCQTSIRGVCVPNPAKSSTPCDDGEQCTQNDRCNLLGQCKGENLPLCTKCSPFGRACDGQGSCVRGTELIPQICKQLRVNFENSRSATCAELRQAARRPPATQPECGAVIKFDITGVTHSCDLAELAGAAVAEEVTNDHGCTQENVSSGSICAVGRGNLISGCTDLYGVCLPEAGLPAGFTCTETITQKLFVGGCLAETRIIKVTIQRQGTTCSGSVTRN